MNTFESSNEVAYQNALQHSFFKALENDLNPVEPNEPVRDFYLTEENLMSNSKNKCDEGGDFNDHHHKNLNHFLSTKSTKKSETATYGGGLIHGSNSDYLFSGFFGQKGEMMSPNFHTVTKPFPMAEEERKSFKTSENEKLGSAFEIINPKLATKKQRGEVENFNGSFLNISINKPRNMASNNLNNCMNTSTISNMSGASSQSTSFNDLVKSVSLSNLNKKKKSKNILK